MDDYIHKAKFMRRVFIENSIFTDLVKKFPAFMKLTFITQFADFSLDSTLMQLNPVHTFTPIPSDLILFCHACISLLRVLFLSDTLTSVPYNFLIFPNASLVTVIILASVTILSGEYNAEVPKMWGAPSGGRCWSSGEGRVLFV
jgi:hypothetical protein